MKKTAPFEIITPVIIVKNFEIITPVIIVKNFEIITPVIIVKNSERTLKRCLFSLSSFKYVVVADNGSTDRSKEIAQSFPNVIFTELPFEGFGTLRNRAAEKSPTEWIFSIDSDEYLPEGVGKMLFDLTLDPLIVYEVVIHNFFNGRFMQGSGWGPKSKTRIYHRHHYQYGPDHHVHEFIQCSPSERKKTALFLYHTPYLSISDFLRKMDLYTSLYAEGHVKKDKKSFKAALIKGFFKAAFTFFRSFFLQKGFMDGFEGLFISFYNAGCSYYKEIKLATLKENSIQEPNH